MTTSKRKATRLFEAKFDPKLKLYINLSVIGILLATIVGIVLIPFWLIGMGYYLNRYFEAMHCELTTRALHFRKGVLFKTERTVPLDKIQDLTFKEGPLLRYMGLSKLKIETAGQSVQGAADMELTGIIDAKAFREMVLDQRDEITDRAPSMSASEPSAVSPTDQDLATLLREMNETLKRIEQKI